MLYAEIASVGFYLVCLFQLALIFGAPWGEYTQGGGSKGKLKAPGRIAAGFSIVVLVVMAQSLIASHRQGLLANSPAWLINSLVWFTFGYSVLGFIMNWASRSKKERFLWGPVATVLLFFVAFAVFGPDSALF